jgi:hypothetical protein
MMKSRIITWGVNQADGFSSDDTIVGINSFVKRQTASSRFSHFEGTDDELLVLVQQGWEQAKPGYRDGVLLIPVKPSGFFSGVVKLEEGDTLTGSFEARREGEKPRKTVTASSRSKMPAQTVEIVLYNSTVLAEDEDNELPVGEDSWEVISINASPELHEPPINPNVLMHNHFGSSGGTKTNLTDEDFVAMLRQSFVYWSDKAMADTSTGEEE